MKRIISCSTIALVLMMMSWGSARPVPQTSDLLQVLPDGNGVVVIDFQKITASALWSSVTAQQKLKGFIDKTQSEIVDLGFRLNDVHAIALVFSAANFKSPIAAINGGFDQKDMLDRLRSSSKVKLTSEKYKGFDVYDVKPLPSSDPKSSTTPANGNTATIRDETSFVFRDASTIVIGTAESVRASVDVMSGARPSVRQNTQLSDGLAQSSAAAIKFAIVVTPSVTTGLQSSDLPLPDFSTLKLMYGSIDISSGIELNATLRSDTEEHAKSIADRLTGLLDMAKGYLGAVSSPKYAPVVDALKVVSITNSSVDVRITGSFPADLLSRFFPSAERKSQ